MNKVTRYVLFGIALCLLVSVCVYGVLSANQIHYGIQGDIVYEVEDFSANLTFNHVSGAEKSDETLFGDSEQLSTHTIGRPQEGQTNTLSLGQTLYFTNQTPTTLKDIIIQLNVTHDNVYAVQTTITPGSAFAANGGYYNIVGCEVRVGTSGAWSSSATAQVSNTQTATFQIKFTVTTTNFSQLATNTNSNPLLNIVLASA